MIYKIKNTSEYGAPLILYHHFKTDVFCISKPNMYSSFEQLLYLNYYINLDVLDIPDHDHSETLFLTTQVVNCYS